MTDPIEKVRELVDAFRRNLRQLTAGSSAYQETEARVEFIDPLFVALGWDMANLKGLPVVRRDVLRELSQKGSRPDYSFRVSGETWFFLEAKRPSIDIRTSRDSAFQIRSYGFTAGHPVGVLTNFRTLRVYNTSLPPRNDDDADVALLLSVDYEDFEARYQEISDLIGRQSVESGKLAEKFPRFQGVNPASALFFGRINRWRLQIATDLLARYPKLSGDELSDLSQKLINRLIFMRMCEDRGIEGEEMLRKTVVAGGFVELRSLFRVLDKRYNTGLFRAEGDGFQDTHELSSKVLETIVDEIYAPSSPYSFGVLDADFLGQVYERFLVDRLEVGEDGVVRLQPKPVYENREVVTTPQPLVDEIVRRSVAHRVESLGGTPEGFMKALLDLRVLDIAVGSGRFLLRVFDELVSAAVDASVRLGRKEDYYQVAEGDYRLSFGRKRDILNRCLYGIDIDFNAVEVARFSLLVRLLEQEGAGTLPLGDKILPDLDGNIIWGNTVVGIGFASPDQDVQRRTRPIDWAEVGLPASFDIVVGNPPYMKTEDMIEFNNHEFEYFKLTYSTPFKQFDKYFVFLERALTALSDGGTCGLVVPNKWLTGVAGKRVRELLAAEWAQEIVDFGTENVFEGNLAYVCLLLLYRDGGVPVKYRYVRSFDDFMKAPADKGMPMSRSAIPASGAAWLLPGDGNEALILNTLARNSVPLGDIASVKNGIQTSADGVFLISNHSVVGDRVVFYQGGRHWEIEAAITRPHIKDSDVVSSYRNVHADCLVIFPYMGKAGKAVLISPADMEKEYPLALAYLEEHRAILDARKMTRKDAEAFYAFGRHQALETVFHKPKIIYSVNQRGEKYGIDNAGTSYASGGTAGEVAIASPKAGYALEFILGLLNQWPIEVFARKRGSPFKGGWFSRGSAVIVDVPVPALDLVGNPQHIDLHSRIVILVNDMIKDQGDLGGALGREREEVIRRMAIRRAKLTTAFNEIWGLPDHALEAPAPR